MSRYFFIGGFLGFALMFAITISSGGGIHVILRNSMVGCLVFAFLFHFYFNKIARLSMQARLHQLERQRRAERDKAREREGRKA